MLFRLINRTFILPSAGFAAGFISFGQAWQTGSESQGQGPRNESEQRVDILDRLAQTEEFKKLTENFVMMRQSELVPGKHRNNSISQGLLFGRNHIEIDPVIFQDHENRSMTAFYHLGEGLSSENGNIHKGVLALLLDEALCFCGFPTLPNKKGVTGRLNIKYQRDIPADSTLALRAHVVETKGRKCIIKGTLESVPEKSSSWKLGSGSPTVYAEAECILVEPRWYKYVTWLSFF
ncbi:Mrx3p Ecym_7126 [Eremothecium cymbalariae DBVPG|uniref:Thioesterase domain-containing protein n=1 Tax=Eremothecium cymbalariae (strain CBS 270.75 / DBVPG 7215 / KCTC 17166 / NRRL Y-17582) TaxID=931890 RepID=G8JVW1_ERECY|nr:hypothetical protein Ecym_7126 [Eremothecium cymbalariae DBVPG\